VTFVYRAGGALPAEQRVTVSACTPIPFSIGLNGAFFTATPTNGLTNGTITLNANPAGLAPGEYNGTITFSAPDAVNSGLVLPVQLIVAPPPPEVTARGIVNAASGQGSGVAPGEVVVLYGANLGPQQLYPAALNGEGKVATELQGTRVYFDGIAAPMVYTFATQVSAVVPYAIASRQTTQVEVEYLGTRSAAVTIPVAQAAPGIFTRDGSGTGFGAILHSDFSVNGMDNPAAPGSSVILYLTGEGQTDPGGVDGRLASSELPKPILPVEVTIGAASATIDYCGAAPGLVAGVMQINARIPAGTPAGAAEVMVRIGTFTSRSGVTVAVK
jgi:uncharacterized protein (TIGR03437 family)